MAVSVRLSAGGEGGSNCYLGNTQMKVELFQWGSLSAAIYTIFGVNLLAENCARNKKDKYKV